MENQKKKLYIKVPTSIVRNENYFLSNQEFIMYARLCFLYFRNYKKKEIEIDHKRFMRFLKISDTRTFKNRLKKLYEVGLVENEINKLPTKGSLKIIFNDDIYYKDKHFTMLSSELFSYFIKEQIDEYAFRQVFYYKSHINMNDEERDRSFCFVSYDTLSKRLKISKSKVIEANRQLEKANLIKIDVHELETNYEYNELDELIFNKFNNHYYVANALF
ncbi:helix-turn-helix domain-containing protein [Bacillus sp. FSL W8-0223]|uniref:helix-turn-helix domain-containing protein n=1 Tax=Bacillus sp. FSL W8-0223 TaxID=2954595 RepID=UPI0030F5F3B2